VKLAERKTVVTRGPGATIEYLNKGMCVSTQENTWNYDVGLHAVGIHQLEVPAFEAGFAPPQHVV
jgi:hypothetical protein